MEQRALNRALLARQGLLERSADPIPRLLEQMAGLQPQYAPSMYIGLWSRLEGLERADLTRALEDRSVVQATLMRSTIRDQVRHQPDHVAAHDRRALRGTERRHHQLRLRDQQVPLHREERQSHRQQAAAVDRRREVLAVVLAQVLRQQRRRPRQHRDQHEQQQIADQHGVVDDLNAPQHRVVVDPDHADGQERHDIGRVARPLLPQLVRERARRLRLRHPQLEHQQRDRDRDDAVGERLEPRLAQGYSSAFTRPERSASIAISARRSKNGISLRPNWRARCSSSVVTVFWSVPRFAAISSSASGLSPSPSPSSGEHSSRRICCCCIEKRGVADSSPGTSVISTLTLRVWQNAMLVWPQRMMSPSWSRRWPSSRISLTNVPFCDQPSSSTVHSPARNSNCACSRDTSRSHGSAMSASKRRPTVNAFAVSSSPTSFWWPLSSR